MQPHPRALLTRSALPAVLQCLTAQDLPAPHTLCSLAMKTTASPEEISKLARFLLSWRLSEAPTALAVTL